MGAEPGSVGIFEQPLAQLAADVCARLDAFVGILASIWWTSEVRLSGRSGRRYRQSDGLLEQMADQPLESVPP